MSVSYLIIINSIFVSFFALESTNSLDKNFEFFHVKSTIIIVISLSHILLNHVLRRVRVV